MQQVLHHRLIEIHRRSRMARIAQACIVISAETLCESAHGNGEQAPKRLLVMAFTSRLITSCAFTVTGTVKVEPLSYSNTSVPEAPPVPKLASTRFSWN